jgi:uncharacterized protein YbgA (DUF1722 family)
MTDIDFFFRSPRTGPEEGPFSQLYLLRRDIDTCFGTDPNTGDPTPHCKAIWPGTMTVLTGVDLLGQFLAGDDTHINGGVGGRFKSFLQQYMQMSASDAEVIYQLRNALLHTFGLYAEKINGRDRVTATYHFTLGGEVPNLLAVTSADHYQVDVQCLRERFETAVGLYERELRNQTHVIPSRLNDNFQLMFRKYERAIVIR